MAAAAAADTTLSQCRQMEQRWSGARVVRPAATVKLAEKAQAEEAAAGVAQEVGPAAAGVERVAAGVLGTAVVAASEAQAAASQRRRCTPARKG